MIFGRQGTPEQEARRAAAISAALRQRHAKRHRDMDRIRGELRSRSKRQNDFAATFPHMSGRSEAET